MAIEHYLRSNGKHNQSVTERVPVLTVAQAKDAQGVGQPALVLELPFQVVVSLRQIVTQVTLLVVGVG